MAKNSTFLKVMQSKLMTFIVIISIVGFCALSFSEYLQPVEDFLKSEKLSFKIGTFSSSMYHLIKSAVTLVILFWVVSIFSRFGEKRITAIKGIKSSNKQLISKAFHVSLYFVVFLISLDTVGVDLTTLAIFSGAIGIGVGLGLQKITSNFISGIILLFEKSIENNDLIELSDGISGFVRHTSARYTLVETFDGKEVMIPNEDLITNRVTNWTYSNTKGRVEVHIGISYDSDVDKAMEIMHETAKAHPRCVEEPEVKCFLREFADSSINLSLYFWVDDIMKGRYEPQSDVMREIWRQFKENDISIPFPQRDVYIKNLKEIE